MHFTKELVDKFANDLLIGLSDEENKMVLDEFADIEKDMDLISNIENISSVIPMTHPIDLEDVFLREDEEVSELETEEVLQNAASKNMTSVIVPKVVKE